MKYTACNVPFCCLFPISMSTRLERLMKDFLWEGVEKGRGSHLVEWETVSKPVELRDLGIENLRLCKKTLSCFLPFLRLLDAMWGKAMIFISGKTLGWMINLYASYSPISIPTPSQRDYKSVHEPKLYWQGITATPKDMVKILPPLEREKHLDIRSSINFFSC